MTQTQSAPPATVPTAPPPGTTPQAPNARTAGPRGAVAQWFEGTPGRMRAFLILAAAMSVVFGLAAAQGFSQSDGALDRAQANTAQLVRIQAIHTNLVSANADATNAFLVGGLEPPEQRAHFVNSLAAAAGLIAEAATAQPADRDVLGALNKTLITYGGLIEQARANNRQGLPIGSQYLKDANSVLQDDSLPLVKALVEANEKRVDTEFDGISQGTIWILVGGLLSLVVFAITLRWLARRTHRYLNVPIVAGAALVLLTTVVGGVSLASASNSAKYTRSSEYERTLALSRARIAAYDARSNESLTLIARGSGDAFDKAYNAAATQVNEQLGKVGSSDSGTLTDLWSTYQAVHKKIRTADGDKGDWEGAVAMAVGKNETSDNSVYAFDAFDSASNQQLTATSTAVQKDLKNVRDGLPPIGWLGVPIGILAALLVAWGMSQRLEEYR
ncbi:hypothetical protein EV651_10296 [Kribbella sp. VKM Ac-2571]|uniref:hypothetical protein n=1 Tax=Kribbella sp. VKM Ac-2571 TaxID=2512222 RepID=UPI0010617FF6|nr:hypothetical protein [Kribbella sp. VKM Ac-2571]TDO68177.1 hypothetical protein EV651_10296 [Kribbella sp. VKM Ac-2571]